MTANRIAAGQRLRLSGGNDMEPGWLCGRTHRDGTVHEFIPGQDDRPACVVRLDEPISVDGCHGAFLVLELRYGGSAWTETETVHLELCSDLPEARRWQERRQGAWIESHATYVRL